MGKNACLFKCNGAIYSGWKEIDIQRGLEQVSGRFSITVTQKWPGQVGELPIKNGDKCEVLIGEHAVLTGWVDRANNGFDAQQTWFRVSGRDVTADLCDCSAVYKSGQWNNGSIFRLATDLLKPFNIPVVVTESAKERANGKLSSFSIEEGETVFEALERAAKIKAVMLWTDGKGNLVIGLPGKEKAITALNQGENLLSLEDLSDDSERFSEYTVKGQARGKHNSTGKATDKDIGRYRPIIIIAEDQVLNKSATERAKWEKNIRFGKSERVQARVQSWFQQGDMGALWVPGLTVSLSSAYLGYEKEDFTIASVNYRQNDREGTVCEMELVDPLAFDLLMGVTTKDKSKRQKKKGRGTGRKRRGKTPQSYEEIFG